MNAPQKHHFIPRFFQRNWLNENLLNENGEPCLYSVRDKKLLMSKELENILMERNLYSMPNIRPENPEYLEEEYFKKIDGDGARAIQNLLKKINKDKKIGKNLINFICALYVRTPDVIYGFTEHAKNITKSDLTLDDIKENVLYKIPCTIIYLYDTIYKNKKYYLLELTNTNIKFLTGNFPLHITDGQYEILLAISPTMAIYTDKDLIVKYTQEDIVKKYNETITTQSKTILSYESL